jgi:AcrR family transcriptional regulator
MTNYTDRQKQIIQVSLDLIANSGIHGLTIKNISKKVGITEPAIYRHFDSKSDILMGVISKVKESSGVDLFTLENKTLTTKKLILKAFTTRAQRFTKNPSIAAVIFSEAIFENDSVLSGAITSIMGESHMKMVKIIKRGQGKGEIVDFIKADQLALMIIGAFRLLVTKWHMSNNSFDLIMRTKSMVNAFEQLI